MPATQAPYSQYFDKNGQPLDAGYVWFGLPNENPKTSPVNVYWDADLTQPALQPIRTLAGYLARNGSPAQVFTDGAYSQTVENKRFEMVYYAANSADYSDLPIRVAVITATDGQTLVNLPFAYTRGNNSLAIYLNGILLIKDKDYTETSTTSVTMIRPLKIGPGGADEVTAIGGRLINAASAIDAVSAAALAAGSGAGLVGYDPSLTFPAGTVGERLQQTTYTVDAITAVNAPALGLVDGDMIQARGRTVAGDVDFGFPFLVESSATANGGTVFSIGGGLFANLQYSGSINARWFGATGNGATDDTGSIQAAIDQVAVNGGRLYLPEGIYAVSQIVLKSFVTLMGSRNENGWARLLTYTAGSVIKALPNSGLSPVRINNAAVNWGIQNLVIDANKANQTHPGVHCLEHLRTAAGDSFGGLIDGCKFVNPTGWGALLIRCRPLDIRDTFFMSGAAFIQCYDMNISGCSIDGTDSKHPSVLWDSCNSVQAVGNLIWRGESPSQQTKQAATVDTVNGWMTVTDDTQFYDNQPVTIESSGSMPTMTLSGSASPVGWTQSFLAKKLGSNRIQLWRNNTNSSTGHAVLFSTAGSSVFLTSGARDIFCAYEGFNQKISDNRIAGSPAGAYRSHRCSMVSYENNDSYLLNFDDLPDQDSITLIGAVTHTITNSFVGDLDQDPLLDRVLSAIRILDDTSTSPTIVSSSNIIGPNQYNVTQGLFVADQSTASYETRNIIVGLDGLFGGAASGVNRVLSPTHRSEPLRYFYSAKPTSAQTIATSSTTDIAWTAVAQGNPRGITDGTSITFPMTANSLIEVSGSIGFTRVAGTYYVLVFVAVNGVSYRFYFEQEVTKTDPGLIAVPFSVVTPVLTNAVVTVQVFQTSAGNMTLQTSEATSRLTVRKLSDYQYV